MQKHHTFIEANSDRIAIGKESRARWLEIHGRSRLVCHWFSLAKLFSGIAAWDKDARIFLYTVFAMVMRMC